MLHFVFTIDGDWEEYYDRALPEMRRVPDKTGFLKLLESEISLAAKLLGGRFIHFVHTSPMARSFFLQPEFINKFREIERRGGSVGVHCHEDDPHRAYYFDDPNRMSAAISFFTAALRGAGLSPRSYRGGYLAFSEKTIPILERNGIHLDFSCEPGRHLLHDGMLVSDWRGAPDNFYRLDPADHKRPGESGVFEIPLGIYIERSSFLGMFFRAMSLKKRKGKVVVSVLAHSYEFGSLLGRAKIVLSLVMLRFFGEFVNADRVMELVKEARS